MPPVESFVKDYMVNKEDICKILEKGMNYRDYNSLDDHYNFKMNKDGSINGIDTADKNKRTYIENYVTKMQMHCQYVIDSKINPKYPRLSFQLSKVVFTDSEKSNTLGVNSFLDGTMEIQKLHLMESFKKYHNCILLRVLQREGSQLQQQFEIILKGCQQAHMQFSEDGKLLALFCREKDKTFIRVFEFQNESRDEYRNEVEQKLQSEEYMAQYL